MRINAYLSTTLNVTLGKYNYTLEITSCHWRLYKRFDDVRGIISLQFGPVCFVRMDDEKADKWFESLVEKEEERQE